MEKILTFAAHWDGHQMYNQGYNVYTHTSHTDFSTDLSWDGQSLILWQQWRREGVGRGGLEGREDRVIKCCVGSPQNISQVILVIRTGNLI